MNSQSIPLKIAILGCRGIPNRYGGFEQFAEKLSVGLVADGHQVWVYNSHNHPCRDALWHGVHRVLCYDPEYRLGQFGQFIYDWNCIRDSRRRGFDIILQLGNTSSSVWHRQLPRASAVVTNMDGLEWKRSKYSRPVQRFLKYAEKLAAFNSDALVADSTAMQHYLEKEYGLASVYIPYGADIAQNTETGLLQKFRLEPGGYLLLIARIQSDNHIETIIKGHLSSNTTQPLVVVGNAQNRFGRRLVEKFDNGPVRFLGGLFDQDALNQLRHHCRLYFHGHSSGGTNPSLLEAMAASALICAHNNPFNRAVLEEDALYFTNENEVAQCIQKEMKTDTKNTFISNNLRKIKAEYSWDKVIRSYGTLFSQVRNHPMNR